MKAGARKVVVGLLLGCVLGIVGLPRLDLRVPAAGVFSQEEIPPPAAVPTGAVAEAEPTVAPTIVDAPVEATVVPAPTVAATAVPPLALDEHFAAPLADWPNDPRGSAWFADEGFHLAARQPSHFVAVGVPVPAAVGDAVIRARFRKLGGPAGGGYGLIVRDQSPASARDGYAQDGEYLVLGVGDRGDVGIW